MGGWIVNAQRKRFCHEGKDGSCFDKYINVKIENEKRLSQNKVW